MSTHMTRFCGEIEKNIPNNLSYLELCLLFLSENTSYGIGIYWNNLNEWGNSNKYHHTHAPSWRNKKNINIF